MDSNNNNNNGDAPSSADVLLSPGRQDSVSDTVLDSEISDDADLEVMRKRINEMEEEAEKLKQMQFEVEKQMQLPGTTGSCTLLTVHSISLQSRLRS